MSKRQQSKYKICRRLKCNLWGRPKSPTNQRDYGPGVHGQRRGRKLSNFGIMLQAKQKLKGYYGNITEKQFRRTYLEAAQRRGDTSEILIGLLESRLDAVIYRMKFVPTVFSAASSSTTAISRSTAGASTSRVTGSRKATSSKSSRSRVSFPMVLDAIVSPERDVPDYLEVDHAAMKGTFARMPKFGDVPYPVEMEPNLAIEFYSK